MSDEERKMFQDKQKDEQIARAGKQSDQYKVSLSSLLRRRYLYSFSIYHFAQLAVYYPEFSAATFFFNKFLGADTEFLSYMSLGLSVTTMVAIVSWKSILPWLDSRISWLKCRLSLLIFPLLIRSVSLAIVPYTGNLTVSVALLVLNNCMMAVVFAGGFMTLNYELDPFNGPALYSVYSGVGQTIGFLEPLIRTGLTSVEEEREGYWEEYGRRWRWFFVLMGGVGVVGVCSVMVVVLGWRDEWRKHPSLEEETVEEKQAEGEKEKEEVWVNEAAE
jgi:hypothetical protein